MRVDEPTLSQAVLPSLAKAGIHEVEQLAEHDLGGLLRRPEFRSGVELYELICELHRHGLTPFSCEDGHIYSERECEVFRLRVVEGLTLDQIGERFGITRESVRRLLSLHFGLNGVPPAARRRPPVNPRQSTLDERRRLYLHARIMVKRYYRSKLTVERVAKDLASSPRQLQRAYAQFGGSTFHDDLVGRRLEVAAELLSTPSIPVRDVAQRVGYRRSQLARAFRRRYGVLPSTYRAKLGHATRHEALDAIAT